YLSVAESTMQRNQAIAEEYWNLKAGVTRGSPVEKPLQAIKDEVVPIDGRGGSGEGISPTLTQTPKTERASSLTEARISSLLNLAGYNDKILKFLQFRPAWGNSTETPPPQSDPIDEAVLTTQQSINALLAKYFLPVFAALLGVTVYILRTASAD